MKFRDLGEIIDYVTDDVKEKTLTESDDKLLSDEQRLNEKLKKTNLDGYFKNCSFGGMKERAFVKQYIAGVLNQVIDGANINKFLDLRLERITGELAFKVLIFDYSKIHGKDALKQLVIENGFLKFRKDEFGEMQRYINDEDIIKVYRRQIKFEEITFKDRMTLLIQIVYESTYGIKVIDELLYQNIDEISGGTVGLPNDEIPPSKSLETIKVRKAYETVNIKVRAAQVKLKFMSFGSWNDLELVCKKLSDYKAQNSLDAKDPKRLGFRKDASRITVIRPPVGECWAFWLRLFPDEDTSNLELINFRGENKVGGIDVLTDIEKLLAKTVSIAICGPQGSGKTTKLKGLVEYYYPFKELRVIEAVLEAWFKRKFSGRDIFSMQATAYLNEKKGLTNRAVYDLSLRTSGLITIFTELRTDEMRVKVIEASNKGSEYNQFTSHEMDPADVPNSLAQSFLALKVYKAKEDALAVIIDAVPIGIEVEVDELTGFRYYNIYEYRKIEHKISDDYKKMDDREARDRGFQKTMFEFFVRLTTKLTYEAVPIVIYDHGENAYVKKNNISDKLYHKIMKRLIFKEEKEELKRIFGGGDQ